MSSETATVASPTAFASEYKAQLLKAIETVDLAGIAKGIEILQEARDQDRQVFVCGNGGSASTASHFVCDMLKCASARGGRVRIMALNDSLPTMLAYANDVSYECIFTEQLKNFAREGDVVIALSGSGNSPNVVSALTYANSIGCQTIALTGRDGGKLGSLANLQIRVAEPHMGRIEDGHMMACHMLCYYFVEV
jgi:D-sedoheptulose 7-phosphate isomerase